LATFVLVHGGGHGGWCWRDLAPLLRDAGHDVVTPTLTGLGERSHLLSGSVDLDTHVTDVVHVLEYENLRDVILVGHSYGGTVVVGVADHLPDRVGRLVFLDAVAPGDGQSTIDLLGGPTFEQAGGRVVDGVELFLFPDRSTAGLFGVTDPDVVAWMRERLTPHPWRSFAQPLEVTDPTRLAAIPKYHVMCSGAPEPGRRWVIDAGHDLMLTAPAETAAALLAILRT
jgi:pimeloyl-ACP methyl ester carboxylesterase